MAPIEDSKLPLLIMHGSLVIIQAPPRKTMEKQRLRRYITRMYYNFYVGEGQQVCNYEVIFICSFLEIDEYF
jgi:hypothetical protein